MSKVIKEIARIVIAVVVLSLLLCYLVGDLDLPATQQATGTAVMPQPLEPARADVTPQKLEPLTAPLTRVNSYLHDFGNGKIIRVPNSINPGVERQPFEAQTIRMVFWYPDMEQTDWPGQMTTIFELEQGTYVEQRDRFRVFMKNLFYSPGDTGRPPGVDPSNVHGRPELTMPDWRPTTMRRFGISGEGENAKGLKVEKSDYEGLMKHVSVGGDKVEQARVEAIWRKHGWDGVSKTYSYSERENSPYELQMYCSNTAASLCEAFVYSKNSGFQYRMVYPSEAIAHTDKLIRSINTMLDRWAEQTESIKK